MEFTINERFGFKHVCNEDGDCVAIFRDEFSYGMFVNGLVTYGGASLFDTDIRQYIVGTSDQMAQASR